MDALADRFRLLSEPTRLRLLWLVAERERCVGDLAQELGCTQANVSKHLSMLSDAGLLERRREGLHCYHMVADPEVFALCEAAWASVRRTADARAAVTSSGAATARS
jgi:DNA-binding transcriptional ArsR family regulator